MSAHSPAPWANVDGVIVSVPLDKIVMVKMDDGTEHPHHTGMVALVYGHHVEGDYTHDANARLIALAPEMLALIKALIDPADFTPPRLWRQQADALLARLEG